VYVPLTVLLTIAGVQVPVMPLSEVAGNIGETEPEQIGAMAAKPGITFGLTVTVNVVVVAHWPASGVNVYVPLAVLLTTAGVQVPVIPFVEVNGNTGATAPEQIGVTTAKAGITVGLTVTVSDVVVAHWPASGVKVYVPLTVLLTIAGNQVPVIPLSDVAGKMGAIEPEHIGATTAKVGVTFGVTVTVSVAMVAHWPPSGVKV